MAEPRQRTLKPLLDLCLFYLSDHPNILLPHIPQDLYPKLYVAFHDSQYWSKLTRCKVIIKSSLGSHICSRKLPCPYHNKQIPDEYRCIAKNSKGKQCKNLSVINEKCWIHTGHIVYHCSEPGCTERVIQKKWNPFESSLDPYCDEHKQQYLCQATKPNGLRCRLPRESNNSGFCYKHADKLSICDRWGCSGYRKKGRKYCEFHCRKRHFTKSIQEIERTKYYRKCKILKLN